MNRLCRIDEASGSQAAHEKRASHRGQRGEAAGVGATNVTWASSYVRFWGQSGHRPVPEQISLPLMLTLPRSFIFVSPATINQGSVVRAFLAPMALVLSAKWDGANP